jgi:hypothetical protein
MQKQDTQIVKLQDEQMLLESLMEDTYQLIKKTTNLNPVKKLIEIHDILSLNASLLHKFRSSDLTFDEIWLDPATIKHLNTLRCTLMVFHHMDFISIKELQFYNRAFCRFLNLILLRLKNGFDLEITTKIS